jgi:hypothetical protein
LRDVPKFEYTTNPPAMSSSLRYTIRADTRPDGSSAVDSVHASGCEMVDACAW